MKGWSEMNAATTRASELLRVVHANPGVTRADAARLIGVGTGAATELVSRLSSAELLGERPAARSGARGRPTTVLMPHPDGPLVLAASITHESWRVDVVELGAATVDSAEGEHSGRDGASVVATVGVAVGDFRRRLGKRVQGLGLAVPGIVSNNVLLEASSLGWYDVDLTAAWPAAKVLVTGNDATLSAAAESRRGAAVGASVALHLRVEAGLGGAVVNDGRVLAGAVGAGGEFGHMPFGDLTLRCPCGALGCWGTAVDGSALARLLGQPPPHDQVTYARRIIALAGQPGHPAETAAVRAVATTLGRGLAGLVNGLDPDLVTLGGLGADLLSTVPDVLNQTYLAGLMSFRRSNPPPVLPSALGEAGPIAGAAEEAWTRLLAVLPTHR
jgi:predicted NBD/HSP70 family sugar kinase